MLHVPRGADRIEVYYRVERWSYDPIAFEDGNFTGRLTSRASDAFVSNFGANYRLPVR